MKMSSPEIDQIKCIVLIQNHQLLSGNANNGCDSGSILFVCHFLKSKIIALGNLGKHQEKVKFHQKLPIVKTI